MALDDDIRTLSAVDLFSELTAEQLRLLAFGAETMRFPAGRELYREDEAADSAYVVARGEVDIFRQGESEPIVLTRCGAGAILGEMALIVPGRRLTGALAASDVETLRLNHRLFRRILEEYPELAARLHARIARQITEFAAQIEALSPRFRD